MAKKDFTNIKAGEIYKEQITEATQAPEPKRKKGRPVSTKDLPHLNTFYTEENYRYMALMSAAANMSISGFVNKIIEEHREAHPDIYKKVKALQKAFEQGDIFNN